MDHFIKPNDELSSLINKRSAELFQKLSDLPLEELNLPEAPLQYYTGRHLHRKFFSVQTAAALLYRSIKRINRPVSEIVLMDYGAGLGSLFLLARMIGCKTVIYNDIREDMAEAARIISNHLQIPIDFFIAGDHQKTLEVLRENHIKCDIILSRNVVEHIYDLRRFYADMMLHQPQALLYFSTTANYHNPAMLLYHKIMHRKAEKEYYLQRKRIIRQQLPQISERDLNKLGKATRGLAEEDLKQAISDFARGGKLPNPRVHYTNTCDPQTGLWCEHILPKNDYQDIIRPLGYTLEFLPAFWDTHYNSSLKRWLGRAMNTLTGKLGKEKGLWTTAFIYIVAEPNNP